MHRLPRGQFSYIALIAATLAAMDSASAAENLPPLQVDPALLGLPPGAPATAPAASAPSNAKATPVAGGGAMPAVGGVAAGAAAVAPVGAVPAAAPVKSATMAKAVPVLGPSRNPGASSGPVNMSVLKVDPALLGPAPSALAAAEAEVSGDGSAPASAPLAGAGGAKAAPPLAKGPTPVVIPLGKASDRKTSPVYITANTIDGLNDVRVVATGNVEVVKADSRLEADLLTYDQKADEVEATGNVRLRRESDEMAGPHLKLKVGESIGFFEQPTYRISRTPTSSISTNAIAPELTPKRAAVPGYGHAERLDFQGEDKYKLTQATYSTCKPGDGEQDWFAKVGDLTLDYGQNHGEANDATVYFMGVPILHSPWLSFALNNERKSGFLAPTIGSSTRSGFEYIQPYYWNIAPNMDATFGPRFLTKRGVQLQGEFRYLGETYSGQMSGEYLPDDKLFGKDRNAFTIRHLQRFSDRLVGSINASHVSDDTYFTDLSTRLTNISTTNVLREGRLTYFGDWWNVTSLVQRYQTLQDPNLATVAKPYDRLPQVTLNAVRADLPLGMVFNYTGEFARFTNPNEALVRGNRTVSYPQLSLPMQTASFFLTPKVGFHSTRYDLENVTAGAPTQLTRNVPIFSVDSGLVFERDTEYFGSKLLQTLEPRLYYLRVPDRDQSLYPVFDSGLADFNFAQIFSENTFTGNDRIADANQLTGAITSRLLNPETGAEIGKVAFGQRYYFADQSVTLPGAVARKGHLADYLGAASLQVDRSLYLDGGFQYNPRDSYFEKFNVGSRWQPEIGKLLNVGYRYRKEDLANSIQAVRQFNVSGQWPLGGGWSGVGRYNYSLHDDRVVEAVGGLEFTENCWSLRFVVQRLAIAQNNISTSFFIQLELNGFSAIGSSPMQVLQRNVPGYSRAVAPQTESIISESSSEAP